MSSSPPFIVGQAKEGEEEELLAIEQGRSHTSWPRSRPNFRLEILIMDLHGPVPNGYGPIPAMPNGNGPVSGGKVLFYGTETRELS